MTATSFSLCPQIHHDRRHRCNETGKRGRDKEVREQEGGIDE